MQKMLFIMNPSAGQKKANKYLADILLLFNNAGYEVKVHMTRAPGDACKAVCRMGSDSDLIVCCGGDGTLNETITGMIRSGIEVPIGYIPAGTTNDFASSLKLPANVMQAAQDIVEGQPVPYDVGKFGDRYFSYVASFGAFTKASYAVPQNIKNALGHTAYVLGGISELSQIRNEHIRMDIDGTIVEDDYLFGAICNATSIGGILSLNPNQVDMGDGLFEILLIRAPRTLAEITDCIQALQTQNWNCGTVTFRSAKKVTITASADMPWTLDGERADGQEEITVENIHRAIRIMQRVESYDQFHTVLHHPGL
ncbi:MAG: YegS/Rv2252/BmrU family lipid kinase [Oscillospiraceae bacterium]|nr:YegS/Rv2252/BmrU family lipid kinase [Oscillospiraceae bacterium]